MRRKEVTIIPASDVPAKSTIIRHGEAPQQEIARSEADMTFGHAKLRPDRNPYHVYLQSLAPNSRPTTIYSLGLITKAMGAPCPDEDFPWWQIRYPHVQKIRADLAARFAPKNVNKALGSLRGVLREATHLHDARGRPLMDKQDYSDVASIKPVRGSRIAPGRALEPEEIASLRDVCEDRAIGVRDLAMLVVLAGGGLRRSEVVGLDVSSFHVTDNAVQFVGKGSKERVVPLPASCCTAIREWLDVRGTEPGPLFTPVTKGSIVRHRRLVSESVRLILKKLAKRAGIEKFSPHDLRRTLISMLLDRGADIASVADIVGHDSVETTRRYDRRGERAKRRSINMIEDVFVVPRKDKPA